jgi:hypothetical protein
MSMSVQATLPPVSMATDPSGPVPPGDQPPTFEMGWGDVRVHATFDPATVGLPAGAPIEVDAWVSVMTRGELAVNQKAGRLAISNETSEAQIQLLSPILAYSDAAIRAAILADVSAAITSLSRNAVGVIPIKLNVSRLGNTVVETVTKEKMNYVVKGNF